jgi:hypothetical protein
MSRIELTRKWWAANRPKDVKGPELERALATVEEAQDEDRAAALAAVPAAIAKVGKGLDKKAQKDLLKSLDSLSALAEAEAKKVATAAKAQTAAKAKADAATKAKAEPAADDEEETPTDKLLDPDVVRNTLKRAIRAPLVFGFALGSKPEQCALALGVRGSPKNLLKLAKQRSGAAKGCCGQAQAAEDDPKTLTLSLDGPLVSGAARALRKYLQTHKITLFRKIRVLVDGQEAETETSDEETPGEPAAATAEAPSAPLTEQEVAVLDDRRQAFKKARAAWVAVKLKAEVDLEKVKDGARTAYLADAQQFPKVVQGCKEIDAVLDNLDDELRDTLDQYASTPLKNQAKLRTLATTAIEILDRYREYVAGSPVMRAIDMKEFADVTIYAPVMKALGDLRKALS